MERKVSRALKLACLIVLLSAWISPAHAQYTVLEDSFDDGDWTTNPRWSYAKPGPVYVSGEQYTSPPYSLKVATDDEVGAIRAFSGLSSANQSYAATFNLYIESMGDQAIPWSMQSFEGNVVAIIFVLPGGTVQLFVMDSPDTWSGTFSTASHQLSYGEWHSFRIEYDGVTTNLYLNDHPDPDASVTQEYIHAPGRIHIGNFALPHTSTYYVDNLLITTPENPNPAPIYVQMGSDTATSGITLSTLYSRFAAFDPSYTSPDGQAARVMATSFRDAHRDSLGNPIKFTWYMLVGSLYFCGRDTGPLLALELLEDYHGESIERWGDEMAYHYHTWLWSDYSGDGIYHWNQAHDFLSCLDDFERTVAHMILDRQFYPSTFRSGWHYMDNFFQCYLDDWYPYRFENDYPQKRTMTEEPIHNVYDWSRAPSAWAPYHPCPDDYQSVGSLRGWESRSKHFASVTKQEIESIFLEALSGTPQLLTFWSHLKEEDFPEQITRVHGFLTEMHDALPVVQFHYLTARECMLKWRDGNDTTSPEIAVSTSDHDGLRTAVITSNEEIYQLQPFAAHADLNGVYQRIDCTPIGENQWQVQYRPDETLSIAVGVTDWFGNPTVQFLPNPLRIMDIRTSVTLDSAEIQWSTTNPSDTRFEYHPIGTQADGSIYEAGRELLHRIALSDLTPGCIYMIKLGAEDEFGQYEESELYIVTQFREPMIVDNLDDDFSVEGSWNTGTVAAGTWGPDYRWTMTSPTGVRYAYWTWQVAETGVYKISAWWSEGTNRSVEAEYAIIHNGEEYPHLVNQQTNGGMWNELRSMYLEEGDIIALRLSNRAPSNYVVIADAAKLRRAFIPISGIRPVNLLPEGQDVRISNVTVTAEFDGEFYVQALDRSAGVKVMGSGVSRGDIIDVFGSVMIVDGERSINASFLINHQIIEHAKPLAVTGRNASLYSSNELNAVGLLVTTWGSVTDIGDGYIYIDDGSYHNDGSGHVGIRVICDPSEYGIGDYLIVTGINSRRHSSSGLIPQILVRNGDDIIKR